MTGEDLEARVQALIARLERVEARIDSKPLPPADRALVGDLARAVAQRAPVPDIEEVNEADNEWVTWAHGPADARGCDCGHDGLGIDWHSSTCPGARRLLETAARRWHERAHLAGRDRDRLAALLGEHHAVESTDLVAEVAKTIDFLASRQPPSVEVLTERYRVLWGYEVVNDACIRAARVALKLIAGPPVCTRCGQPGCLEDRAMGSFEPDTDRPAWGRTDH